MLAVLYASVTVVTKVTGTIAQVCYIVVCEVANIYVKHTESLAKLPAFFFAKIRLRTFFVVQ